VLGRAADLLAGTQAEAPLGQLCALWEAARASAALREVVRLDLGEIRGLAYYTGAIFHVVAEGPGEPIASGGRYDGLLGRFGVPMPAVGFALHLDAVARARDAAGIEEPPLPRILVAVAGERGVELAAQIRATGVAAVAHAPDADPEAYAAAWGFSHIAREREGAIAIQELAQRPGLS
jgi:ATP phosphoribosyltransferase regulatory subunit